MAKRTLKNKEETEKDKDSLLHIRVGTELKKQMQMLIDSGLFSNQAEVAREGIRDVLLKYSAVGEKRGDDEKRRR